MSANLQVEFHAAQPKLAITTIRIMKLPTPRHEVLSKTPGNMATETAKYHRYSRIYGMNCIIFAIVDLPFGTLSDCSQSVVGMK